MRVSQRKSGSIRGRAGIPLLPLAVAVAGLLLAGGFAWQLRPSVVLGKRQAALLSGIERRNPGRIQRLVAEDYADRWEFNRDDIVTSLVDAGGQFLTLVLTPEGTQWEIEKGRADVTMRLVVGGNAVGPAAQEVMRRVNTLEEPFVFTWEKKSFLPSDWKLVRVENESLPDDLHGYEPGDIRRALQGE